MGGSGMEIRQYVQAVVKRFWLVVLLVVLAVGGVYYRMKAQPLKFEATTILMVTAPVVNPPMTSTTQTGATSSASQLPRQAGAVFNDIIQLFTSRPITERVAQQLGLGSPGEVKRNVTVSQIRGTDLITVRATYGDREMASKIANTTAEQFIAFFREASRRDARDLRIYIEQQLAQARARLDESDRLIQTFKERHGIVDLNAQRAQATAEAAQVRSDRDTTMLHLKEIDGKLTTARARLANEKIERITFRATRDNPVFMQLQTRLTELEITKADLSQVYTPQHPKRQQIEGEIAQVRQQMQAQARSVLSEENTGLNPLHDQLISSIVNLEVDRSAGTARMDGLNFVDRRRQASLTTLPAVETGLTGLQRENKILDQNYSLLAARYQEALLRENEAGYVPAGVQVMEPALAPNAPTAARLPLFAGIAALVGLLLGMMAAIFLETSEDRIHSPQDAERTLGAPVLVGVPNMAPSRAVPAGAALLVALFLTMLAGGSIVAARTVGETRVEGNTAVSILVRLGRGIDGLAGQVGQVIR